MSEPTLVLRRDDYRAQVGNFLGWGFDPLGWDENQTQTINIIVESGYRQFLYPEPMEGETSSYDWSFIKPTAQLSFAINASEIHLPDDFGGADGPLTILTSTTTAQPWRIEWRNEGEIRRMYSVNPTMTGPPMYGAIIPKRGTGPTDGQRFNLLIFPIADQPYTFQLAYYINPDALTGDQPFAYGGVQHVETILESCLAIAEERFDDSHSVHAEKFKTRLMASISMDRRNKPQKTGYNGDRSDNVAWERYNPHYWAPPATYNGGSFG